MANTARAGQVIQHNNTAQPADETLGPCFLDYILYNTIRDIDPQLTKHIQNHYKLKITAGQRLTDLKEDIFNNIPKFLEEIQQQESLSALRAQSSGLAALKVSYPDPANKSDWNESNQLEPQTEASEPASLAVFTN